MSNNEKPMTSYFLLVIAGTVITTMMLGESAPLLGIVFLFFLLVICNQNQKR